ncbi:RNA polymerase sigma-70 factor, ECF subfamily [Chitinophaga ginsengisegetis]|uniref:RNA polymerase sigma-70 factor, ECF subfamily n=1 Tax=Chitinophaga ginsengisegetis TaxID=393003 RepID=A0A1T5N577_9BACT|nr:RNA polymerase sigma-70 factor [Chitinophaga ginsengisegetis]MDR6568793.1 RNA polymerase sigma-70 factor (ECF subfamily) [Chitinophaga ginsengisegetis]MDR6647976.1 RNA polymerase sigma-70 factor (ECF subfamily) [Chitinophaga ginsengisegetis]MDR6654874.1 RNA polymerase sigma-70 factor (ECF subfamily) [Chitinophaga ginsengisegetis]SKC95607.1 RNA polymerase sigma-70 factor, ECF subfamily [Chitinophaga ginsengisegetis]
MQAAPSITASLLLAFRNGETWAFNEIFTVYDARLMAYAAKICATRQDAEEVVQDVFISLWENRLGIEGPDISGWLIKVCRNKALKSLRRHVFQADISTLPDLAATQQNPLEQLYFDEIEEYIRQVIQTLPPARKKIFLMNREQHLSYQQIADELGISVFTVKKQISLAIQHLRATVTPYACSLALIMLPPMLN